jgi:serine phosphatase RsbU (regulator of sigma subunit)
MDQQTHQHRVLVIVSGALSLTTLTVGESSPFRGIASRVFVGDLSESQSQALIEEELAAADVGVSRRAHIRLLQGTNGDPYLIRRICQRCIDRVAGTPAQRLRGRHVKGVMGEFLDEEVYEYAPLQEAVRLIEEDPDLLRCVLRLLAHGATPKAELPLPLSPDVDPLYLTGVVERVRPDSYRIQNRIYARFLQRHFHPGHVGHLLTMVGLWDSALDYLEAGIKAGSDRSRADLLPATINSMYASDDVGQAARFLTRGLSAAFSVVEARVWYAPPHEKRLRLVAQGGRRAEEVLWASPEMPVSADRLEARAFRQARALRGPEGERYVWRAIPLLIPGRKPAGVVTLCDDLHREKAGEQREREMQMVGYLNQAARAIQAVSTRRQELALAGRMQASLLPGSLPRLDGWEIEATLRPARETSGDFYDLIPLPGGRLGLVVADVTDKGMGAALFMALSRTLLRTYASDYPERPDLALGVVNDRILADTDSAMFVTTFYGILDPARGTLTYCNAGHHPPYLWSGDQEGLAQALPGRGMALGVVDDTDWGHTTLELPPGSLLLLYSDGVLDAQSPSKERFGNQQMLESVAAHLGDPALAVQNGLLSRLQQFMGDEPQFDDITLMAVRRDPQRSRELSHPGA